MVLGRTPGKKSRVRQLWQKKSTQTHPAPTTNFSPSHGGSTEEDQYETPPRICQTKEPRYSHRLAKNSDVHTTWRLDDGMAED